jgi:hypothetical protein
MTRYVGDPLIYTWLFLSIATVFSWWLGLENDTRPHQSQSHTVVTVLILLIAIIKCRFVIWNYMEVRLAPAKLRLTCDAWLILNFGMVSCAYWIGR